MWAAWAQQQQQVHSSVSSPDTCWDGRERPVGERARIQLGVQRVQALGLWSKAEFQVKGPEL